MSSRKNLIGKILQSRSYGEFEVISQGGGFLEIRFIKTGFVNKVGTSDAKAGRVKDVMYPSVHGVGYIGVGEFKPSVSGVKSQEYNVWVCMLQRCYSEKYQKNHPTYKGCLVCAEWHNFQNFASWYSENSPDDGIKYELDKDLKVGDRGKLYSPNTCSLITQAENSEIASAKRFKFKSPENDIVEVFNLRKFCRLNNLHHGNMSFVSSGRLKSHKGWSAA
jgi:hypothetical protein